MIDPIKKAMQDIEIPDELHSRVVMGIRQTDSERRTISMTRSVKKIAAVAAAIVICAAVVGAAVLGGHMLKTDGSVLNAEDISLKFTGFDSHGAITVSADYADPAKAGKDGLKAITLGSYSIVDENGEVTATGTGDEITYTNYEYMVSYWADESGELHFANMIVGDYKVLVYTMIDENGNEISGSWELDFNFDEWPYGVYFDPSVRSEASVEKGTAYIAERGDIEAEFVDTPDGKQKLEITVASENAPYSSIKQIFPVCFVMFDENRDFAGGIYLNAFDCFEEKFKIEFNYHSDEFSWGSVDMEQGEIYVNNSSESLGRVCTLKIYTFAVLLDDGSRLEIKGDWMVDFTV